MSSYLKFIKIYNIILLNHYAYNNESYNWFYLEMINYQAQIQEYFIEWVYKFIRKN